MTVSVQVKMVPSLLIVAFFSCYTVILASPEATIDSLIDKISSKIARVVVSSDDHLAGSHKDIMNFLVEQTVQQAGSEVKQLQKLLQNADSSTKSRLQLDLGREIMKKIKLLGAERGDDNVLAPRFLTFFVTKVRALAGAVVGVGIGALMGALGGATVATAGCSAGSCLNQLTPMAAITIDEE